MGNVTEVLLRACASRDAEIDRLRAELARAADQIAQAIIDRQATEDIAAVLQAQVVGLTAKVERLERVLAGEGGA